MSLQQVNDTLQQTIVDGVLQISALQQSVASQNQSIVTLEETVEDKCDVIDQQNVTLQQLNDTLQMFIETQEAFNSEQDVIAANLTALSARFPREYRNLPTFASDRQPYSNRIRQRNVSGCLSVMKKKRTGALYSTKEVRRGCLSENCGIGY